MLSILYEGGIQMNRKLDWSRDNVIAFQIDNKIEEQEYKEMLREVEQLMEQYDKIRIFMKVPDLEGTELSTIADRFKFVKENNMDQIEKYALVGEQKTTQAVTKAVDVLSSINTRQYPFDEEEAAKKWIFE
ncbi:hypothetical protein C6Y45_13490 [Alkalicoccus saliphilus]|uniref:STAS/SEC14 domain-containing protein n=2 Tax=Alkalicoccus saliphilus TaxID=200989 RepID=A0A2T4U3P7_9BACI|nr:hypothetical protein C6Y45_13490 [Alkalicoccus saliphilus]